MDNITKYFNKPQIMGILADVNEGKSNLIYYLIKRLREKYNFKLATFGLKFKLIGAKEIYSLEELEIFKDGIVFIDEFYSLFDLDDRKKKRQIERSLRLIHHNNNILVLAGVPENFKKFIASKISVCFYKKVKISDFINGSSVKSHITSYAGMELGSQTLSLNKNQVLVFDGNYRIFKVPHLRKMDSKLGNKDIFVQKFCEKSVLKNVESQISIKSGGK